VIARGNNRHPIFAIDGGHAKFLELVQSAKVRYPAKLYHYCLMSNHLHLLLVIDVAEHLPKFMQAILQGYGRWYKAQTRYWGHVWQGRFKSPLVPKESYFLEAGRYIERNPLRAKMVEDLAAYRWSSYRYYALGEPNLLVEEDPYYAPLGPTAIARQAAYREFVRLESPYGRVLDQQFLETAF